MKITLRKLKKISDSNVFVEVPYEPKSFNSTIHKAMAKIRKRGDLRKKFIKYLKLKA